MVVYSVVVLSNSDLLQKLFMGVSLLRAGGTVEVNGHLG